MQRDWHHRCFYRCSAEVSLSLRRRRWGGRLGQQGDNAFYTDGDWESRRGLLRPLLRRPPESTQGHGCRVVGNSVSPHCWTAGLGKEGAPISSCFVLCTLVMLWIKNNSASPLSPFSFFIARSSQDTKHAYRHRRTSSLYPFSQLYAFPVFFFYLARL